MWIVKIRSEELFEKGSRMIIIKNPIEA